MRALDSFSDEGSLAIISFVVTNSIVAIIILQQETDDRLQEGTQTETRLEK